MPELLLERVPEVTSRNFSPEDTTVTEITVHECQEYKKKKVYFRISCGVFVTELNPTG